MERKLASIRQITDIQPIEGADKIELVTVDGWKVVVAKDVGHKVNDFVVYCEVDSFLPIKPEFEFLRKSSYKKMGDQEGFRLRTIKLKNRLSQGLILPIKEVIPFPDVLDYMEIGKDVTELLGIVKYEPPIPAELSGKVKSTFPSFITKTDEERIQNLVKYYQNWRESDKQFYVTEKLDGSSATFYIKKGEFGVCSRNLDLLETEGNTFWKVARELNIENKLNIFNKVARELDIEDKLKIFNENIAIQGELIGEGIQGNPYKIKGHTVRFFNAYDISKQERIPLEYFLKFIDTLGLETVPILDNNFKLPETIYDILNYAEGKSALNNETEREGIVIRSTDGTISFKAISNKFLLKN